MRMSDPVVSKALHLGNIPHSGQASFARQQLRDSVSHKGEKAQSRLAGRGFKPDVLRNFARHLIFLLTFSDKADMGHLRREKKPP